MVPMTREIALVFAVLAAAVVLFSTERLRADIVAVLIMVALPWLGLLEAKVAFSGLSSNAVLSLMGVMVMGAGIESTGLMNRVAHVIVRLAGNEERRLTMLTSAFVGSISAFMQNIGAVALFLPAVLGISRKTRIPASRLLMPMGFAAILGGTLTLVASGPMIILNDLLRQGGLPPLGLFSVTPIGLALLASGILYFALFGKVILPGKPGLEGKAAKENDWIETWDLPTGVISLEIPPGSPLAGRTLEEAAIWQDWGLHLLFLVEKGTALYAPWRHSVFSEGQVLGIAGDAERVLNFSGAYGLRPFEDRAGKAETLLFDNASFAQYVILPRSPFSGRTIREIALRRNFGVEPLVLLSGDRERREDFSDEPLRTGDALVVHGPWENLRRLGREEGVALVTPLSGQPLRESKSIPASACFLLSIGLAVAGFPLSLSLLSGALAMVLFGVLSMDEAYRSIDWKTVFLLAGLIPLGLAMERTGGARFLAERLTGLAAGSPPLVILLILAGLSTLFSLFMSNVAATVLLVPFAIVVAKESGLDPRALAMLVGFCVANSFILPTHQVNALLLSPGGYRNADFIKAGSGMSILFVLVAAGAIRLFYL
jgi:di/tricarboxylate transporter